MGETWSKSYYSRKRTNAYLGKVLRISLRTLGVKTSEVKWIPALYTSLSSPPGELKLEVGRRAADLFLLRKPALEPRRWYTKICSFSGNRLHSPRRYALSSRKRRIGGAAKICKILCTVEARWASTFRLLAGKKRTKGSRISLFNR